MNEQERFKFNELYQTNSLELFALLRKYDDDARYKEGEELADWKRQMYSELIELLQRQIRTLDYQMGRKIEPKTHYSEAVFYGKMGGEA